ncbi:hypothetical protein R5R35_009664 [Gryllus longicercus]|uniref:Gamma-tubulin complex component n=1 Tax=Gryllus longicercus TaxID=2509291 RepID=A0AAN9VE23_9ORTH
MSKYKIEALTGHLIEALDSKDSPELYVEDFHQSVLKYNPSGQTVTSQKYLSQLTKLSPNPQQFTAKYDELKERNVDHLQHFVQLLSLIAEDKKLKHFLHKNAKKTNESKPTENMRMIDVPRVVNKLKQVAKYSKENEDKDRKKKTQDSAVSIFKPIRPTPTPDMSLDFSTNLFIEPFPPNLGPVPTCSQEGILIEDLLCCLEGVEGNYIVPKPLSEKYGQRHFIISDAIDPALEKLLLNILPVASDYSMVVRFIEEHRHFDCGQVNHALAAAMLTLVKDYRVFVTQLESLSHKNFFSLSKMNYYLQPMKLLMDILAKIASAVGKSGARGGKVLSLLHEQTAMCMGNTKSQELCLYLTQKACVPYMEMLEKWLYKGVIYDPHHEFLVEDNEVHYEDAPRIYSADYWEKRYNVSRERIPVFLERMADMILRTGKYLNVIQQCGKNVKPPKAEPLVYAITERQYVEVIETAYSFASKTLLQLVMEENDLMGRLRSVKHYFLLDQGDFIVQFMDSCESELCKNIDDLVPTRLETLLELALRTSAANQDPYKEEISMELLPYDLIFQMCKILKINDTESYKRLQCDKKDLTGLLAFSFNYQVKWPVSLILNFNAIACYQIIFRHLFYCKHIERLLCRVWLKNKLAKTFSLQSSQMYVSAFALRQRMLNYVQNLEYYTMVEVIEPNWVSFLNKMNKVNNIDDVLVCHSDFLDSCLKDSMLTNPDLLQNVYYLLDICMEFYEFIQHMGNYFIDAELTSMLSGYDSSDSYGEVADSSKLSDSSIGRSYIRKRIINETDKFEEAIAKLDQSFTETLVQLVEQIMLFKSDNNNDKLLNLVYRLDFNRFYNVAVKEPYTRGEEETSG